MQITLSVGPLGQMICIARAYIKFRGNEFGYNLKVCKSNRAKNVAMRIQDLSSFTSVILVEFPKSMFVLVFFLLALAP